MKIESLKEKGFCVIKLNQDQEENLLSLYDEFFQHDSSLKKRSIFDFIYVEDKQDFLAQYKEFSPDFLNALHKYYCLLLDISQKIIEGIEEFHGYEKIGKESRLRAILYKNLSEDDNYEGEEHLDMSLFTLIHSSHLEELWIKESSSTWTQIKKQGNIVCIFGELASILTDGQYQATKHQVRVLNQSRASFAYFLHPDEETSVRFNGKEMSFKKLKLLIAKRNLLSK